MSAACHIWEAKLTYLVGLHGRIGWLGRQQEIQWKLLYPRFDSLRFSLLGVRVYNYRMVWERHRDWIRKDTTPEGYSEITQLMSVRDGTRIM